MLSILRNIENPFFKIKDQFGWHLTIKAFLELNKNFPRYERSPLRELNLHDLLKCKKVFDKMKKRIKKNNLEKYFK